MAEVESGPGRADLAGGLREVVAILQGRNASDEAEGVAVVRVLDLDQAVDDLGPGDQVAKLAGRPGCTLY